ncbi:hypothetical protein MRS44_008131 [Fusarium solani]|uniref:uncharacterized protein n=1 Tax=Fusarium solani TaxID=169388 RepID=UPI0032C3FDBD|nr:hypothetical protein MRS44_008131 [Fusarium solani]
MLYQTLVPLLLASSASALQVPSNVRTFYNQLKAKGTCTNKLATGFFDSKFDDGNYGVVYLQGEGGTFSNMDVDCDGAQGGPQDDGRCGESTTTIPTTSIKYIIEGYNVGISDLNPHEHSFVVFGNSGTKACFTASGVTQTATTAIAPSVGEASLSLATACYGKGMQAGTGSNTSHDEEDVLYIAFTGADAVPGAKGAAWTAGNFDDFHASLVGLGNKLIKRIGGGGDECSWSGHCEGASCKVAQDCADALTCVNGKCA